MKPPDASILNKFIKVVGGHLTYALRDKKPKILAEAKEMVMEVEQKLRISKMDVDEHTKAKVEVKKGKSKDQTKETLSVLLKKMDKLNEEMNSRDRIYMNKLTALERAQKSSYIPKGKPLPGRKNEEDKPSSSQVPNTLAPTNAIEQDSSFKDEQNDEDDSDEEEVKKQANIVESEAFNILLGGSYTHPPISEATIKEEKREPILNTNDSGRFKGVQY